MAFFLQIITWGKYVLEVVCARESEIHKFLLESLDEDMLFIIRHGYPHDYHQSLKVKTMNILIINSCQVSKLSAVCGL